MKGWTTGRRSWRTSGLIFFCLVFSVALGGCALRGAKDPYRWGQCEFDEVEIDTDFEGARASACRMVADNSVDILIKPENEPINPSPWYAFRVTADSPRSIALSLHYAQSQHRYEPKLSYDGQRWSEITEEDFVVSEDGKVATLRVDVGEQPLWVAAQELWNNQRYEQWTRQLALARGNIDRRRLGESLQGRSIWMLDSAPNADKAGTVVVLGRQHPPEVTGAYAMSAFVEYLLSDVPVAQDFRKQYRLLVVPNLNPDGVAHGHWRHNGGGVDLNRDWGPFTQPETQLMRDLLQSIVAEDINRLTLVLDFHSTWHDLMYTQRDDEITRPANFTADWIASIRRRLPEYQLERDPENSGIPSARTYAYSRYGVPSITYEVGDQTDRNQINVIAREAAAAMIETLMR